MRFSPFTSRSFLVGFSCLLSATLLETIRSQDLDELLNPGRGDLLEDDANARAEWESVVEAFQRSDVKTASEMGKRFLNAAHHATPYQILGVQVMLALASGEAVALKSLATTENTELERLREKQADILAQATAQRTIHNNADALIRQLTNNRTVGVQQGSLNHQKALMAQAQMDESVKKIDALKKEHEAISREIGSQVIAADESMKGDVIRLLGMLKASQEIPAAFAICNVYLRKFGPDLEVAEFQQDFVRLQKIHDRAVAVVELIRSRQQALVEEKLFWAADEAANNILVRVETESDELELPALVKKLMKADPLGITRKMDSATSESAAILEFASIDGEKARSEFVRFEEEYPDFPRLEALRITILGEETMDRKEIEELLVKEIESSVTVSPEKALRVIESIDRASLSDPEKLRLKVRVSTAASLVIDQMLATLNSDLNEAMSLLGGQELVIQTATASRSLLEDRSRAGVYVGELRARIDRSREHPKAISILRAISHTSENLLLLDIDETRMIMVENVKLKADLLLQAADG